MLKVKDPRNRRLAVAAVSAIMVRVESDSNDGVVPVSRSRNMIQAIKAAGGEPKYTEYWASISTLESLRYQYIGVTS